ncbi:glycine oxidase ThiO [Marinimicrobium sp. ABcell2]|uniref:glycine oxidase ThiO n=1 Tax=Marinimicrobium sp. ABcell2 TaxID=3069751 RepID=UPI0027B3959F|nr:glycine oxidase ThiO [Marinimicrobium sp. ABcell2]MDQ2077275.1 glycine oxidase ThiO [Marinimicrobium sp. ABcell2]
MKSESQNSFAIAGAGLLGRLLAWQLLRQGHKVTLYDAGALTSPNCAAWTAAGMISPLSEAVVSDRNVYEMGLYALQIWPRWLQELGKDDAALYEGRGSLVVAHPQDLSELQQFAQDLEYVLPEASNYRHVAGPEIHDLEPDLSSSFQQGLLLEDEAHLDNRTLLLRLASEIRRLGAHCIEHCPVEVSAGAVISARGEERFDWVLDCRGTGAKDRLTELRGVRGETLHVQTNEVRLHRPVRLMHPRYQLYIVPKPEQRFIIGATQIESEDRSPMSLQSSLELGSALYTIAPAFAEARILEQGVNLRPAFMDNQPHITRTEGLISANGLFRHGYLLAPAVVTQVLAELGLSAPSPFAHLLTPSLGESQL